MSKVLEMKDIKSLGQAENEFVKLIGFNEYWVSFKPQIPRYVLLSKGVEAEEKTLIRMFKKGILQLTNAHSSTNQSL